MKINPKFRDKVITLPASQVLENLKDAGEARLKVLIFALSEQNATLDGIADATGLTKEAAREALFFWKSRDAISVTGLKPGGADAPAEPEKKETPRVIFTDTPPRYTEQEVARILSKRPELKQLIDECNQILDRILNPTEVGDVVVLNEYYGLNEDFLMLLCSHCAAAGKTKLPYIKKTAINLFNDGVTTYAELERYYDNKEKAKSLGSKYLSIIGADRALSQTERETLAEWSAWGVDSEMIEKAYDTTVTNIGEFSLRYLKKIIKNWHDEGIATPQDADRASANYKAANPSTKSKRRASQNGGSGSSFNTGDFFEAALKRSYSDNDGGSKK